MSVLGVINIHARGNGSTLGIELKDFDKVKIEDDLKSVHRLDPLVAKILNVRNDFIGHRSINIVATLDLDAVREKQSKPQ